MKNQIKAGSILSYIQMGLNILIALAFTPIMINLLGKNEYGLYNTVSSTISMLSILSLGFNSGYIRYYSKYKKDNDIDSICRLNGLFLLVFAVIGVIALICGLFLSFNLNLVFDKGLTIEEYRIGRTLMLLLTVNLAISFPLSVFSNIISAHEGFVVLKLIGMCKTVLSPLITIPLLLCGFRSVALVTVSVVVAILADSMYVYYVFHRMKEKFYFSGFESNIFKSIFGYTIFIAINTIIDQINWNVDKMVIGRFKGTAEVALYSTGFTLYHSYQLFSTSISGVFTPRIHRIVRATEGNVLRQREELTELFTRVGRIQFVVLGLVATGLAFFGKFFITGLWVGKGFEKSYYVMLLLVLPASIALVQNLGIEIQRAQNRHQFRSIAYLFMALINLVMSVFLCMKYGAIGSTIGTTVSLIVANGFVMNMYYHKRCNIDIIFFWKNILRLSLGLIPPIVVGICINLFFPMQSLLSFVLLVGLYTIAYSISMWFLGMNNYEKDLVRKLFTRVRRVKG